jgi:Zn-finger nucleic acid-binding protein
MRQVVRRGTTFDACDSCGGRWLDEGELEQMIVGIAGGTTTDAAVTAALAAVERPAFFTQGDVDPDITCPRCASVMRKAEFETGGSNVTADRCEACGGFWFDAGESGALAAALQDRLQARGGIWMIAVAALLLGLMMLWLAFG